MPGDGWKGATMQDFRRAHVLAAARRAAFDRRVRTSAILGVVASFVMAPAAGAEVKGNRVIEVAHGRDLVIMDGYPGNKELVVEVVRNGVTIATTTETHYKTDSTGFLEVNHVGQTDCFDGNTAPDIRPGDTIRTTVGDPAESTDIDTMIVQNVTYDGAPVERMIARTIPAEVDPVTQEIVTPESTVMEGTGIYEVRGTALHADGVTRLEGEIEVRLNHPARANWDASDRRDWRVTAEAGDDGRYMAEFDTAGSSADQGAIADAEMAALWLGSTSELSSYDGPGSPCNPAPNAGITKVSPRVVNLDTESITLEGYAPADAEVKVGEDLVQASPEGGWTYSMPAAELADGPLTLTAVIDGVPVSRTIMVDRTAPGTPTANLPSGEHTMPQTIHLGGENELRYTTDGSAPSQASLKYTGGISVTGNLTIKAVAVDAAGNLSPVATFAYTEKPVVREVPPPAPEPVIVERPVVSEVVREVVREVVVPAPAPVVLPAPQPVVVAPPAVAGIDKVTGPKRVTLAAARKGIRIKVGTKAASITVKANRGGRLTVARKTASGYTLVFTAKRRGIYKLTIAAPNAAAKVITVKVR
jgi:hypothetical protein